MADSRTKSIKVLAIDGGGIRGIIPAVILSELQKRLGKELWQAFDLIAGTSTGGIIALGIGTTCNKGGPYSPDQLVGMYVQNGPAIFRKTWVTPERELILPKYSLDALETTRDIFQGHRFPLGSYSALDLQLRFAVAASVFQEPPHRRISGIQLEVILCQSHVRRAHFFSAVSSH